ncbi:hypothetical protein V6N11_007817 [Hibiscus sabdariffa]|uniref:Uncharacterized protein n=1 Tax=Hibiscus sabdariffa TaxID=183260 RepID=A0ABR2NJW8_9ROSI
MQVVHRKRCNGVPLGRLGTTLCTNKKVVSEGSRFAVIAEAREEGFDQDAEVMIVERTVGEDGTTNLDDMLLPHRVENVIVTSDSGDVMQQKGHGTRPGRSVSRNDGRQDLSKRLDRTVGSGVQTDAEGMEVNTVAAKGKVVLASSKLHTGKHRAVHVVDSDKGRIFQGAKGWVLPASIRGTIQRNGSKVQVGTKSGGTAGQKGRYGDPRLKKNTLSDHLAPLLRDLDSTVASNVGWNLKDITETDGSFSNVNWHPNFVFEQPSTLDM